MKAFKSIWISKPFIHVVLSAFVVIYKYMKAFGCGYIGKYMKAFESIWMSIYMKIYESI